MGAEALELWVMPVANCPSAQDGLREQRFTPKGDQTLRIEIPGMDCPQAH